MLSCKGENIQLVEAALWGALASLSLFLGSIAGIIFHIPKKIIAFIMAFGTGILIGASSFDLLLEALKESGLWITSFSFLFGALMFTIIELILVKKGGKERKRSKVKPIGHSGLAIYFGTLMDAIPESMIIGLSLINSNKVDVLFISAIFVSNFPESLSSTVGLKKDQYSNRKILFLWGSVVVISAVSSVVGYVFLQESSESMIASIGAFGAGGLIAMVCSTMLPEAFEEGGPVIGFITSLGLIISLGLTSL